MMIVNLSSFLVPWLSSIKSRYCSSWRSRKIIDVPMRAQPHSPGSLLRALKSFLNCSLAASSCRANRLHTSGSKISGSLPNRAIGNPSISPSFKAILQALGFCCERIITGCFWRNTRSAVPAAITVVFPPAAGPWIKARRAILRIRLKAAIWKRSNFSVTAATIFVAASLSAVAVTLSFNSSRDLMPESKSFNFSKWSATTLSVVSSLLSFPDISWRANITVSSVTRLGRNQKTVSSSIFGRFPLKGLTVTLSSSIVMTFRAYSLMLFLTMIWLPFRNPLRIFSSPTNKVRVFTPSPLLTSKHRSIFLSGVTSILLFNRSFWPLSRSMAACKSGSPTFPPDPNETAFSNSNSSRYKAMFPLPSLETSLTMISLLFSFLSPLIPRASLIAPRIAALL